MKSIIKMLGTDQFKRMPDWRWTTNERYQSDYVLQRFSKEEMVTMEKVIEHSARAVEAFIESSRFDHVMNEYNGEVN